MSTLFANQGFDTALIALIVAITAYVQQRVSQAKQGAQLDAVQQQQAKQGSAVLVTPMPTVAASTAPAAVVAAQPAAVPAQPAAAPAPVAEPQADVLMGHAAHLAAAQAGLQQAQDALALLLATPLPTAPPRDAPLP